MYRKIRVLFGFILNKLLKNLNIVLKTFKLGGVHPAENKISADKTIQQLAIPKQAFIPLAQHLGVPAVPVVKRGDTVKVGQLLAKGEAFISANVHASVSGTVAKIDNVIDTSGYAKPCIIINVEGDDWEDNIDKTETLITEIKVTKEEIVQKLKDSGIVGLGGATFPSHVKLMLPKGKTAEYLVINGVECEPYLTADHRLMLEKADEMLIGISILMKGLEVNKAIIGIENNKLDAIKHLTEKAKKYQGIEVQALKVQYPQGGEKQLIDAVLGREVPSGGLPIDVGVVVNNVGTALAVYDAVQKNKPLFERVVTITGKNLTQTGNYMCRIGTPISELIKANGELPENTKKVINGGPMMGKALNNLDAPIVKGTSGIVTFSEEESTRPEAVNCIRCGKCVSVCPMGLEPYLLSVLGRKNMFEEAENDKIMDCIECGSCMYICPSARPLLDYIRYGKANVGRIMRERNSK